MTDILVQKQENAYMRILEIIAKKGLGKLIGA